MSHPPRDYRPLAALALAFAASCQLVSGLDGLDAGDSSTATNGSPATGTTSAGGAGGSGAGGTGGTGAEGGGDTCDCAQRCDALACGEIKTALCRAACADHAGCICRAAACDELLECAPECTLNLQCSSYDSACQTGQCSDEGACVPSKVDVGDPCLDDKGVCDATGNCVECVFPVNCPGGDCVDGKCVDVDPGDCCEVHNGSGCSSQAVERCVCGTAPICCLGGGAWGEHCVETATTCGHCSDPSMGGGGG